MKGSGRPPQTYAGPSILEQAWAMLDEIVDRIMEDKLGIRGEEGEPLGVPEASDVGEAAGIARVIALFVNPYNPSLDAVRAEAMQRWEDRQS